MSDTVRQSETFGQGKVKALLRLFGRWLKSGPERELVMMEVSSTIEVAGASLLQSKP